MITPDPWKAGASNVTKPGGRKVGENKLLTASKNRFNPMTTEFRKCKICKVTLNNKTGFLQISHVIPDVSAKSSPGRVTLLSSLRLQERDLRHVWGQDIENSGIQTKLCLVLMDRMKY